MNYEGLKEKSNTGETLIVCTGAYARAFRVTPEGIAESSTWAQNPVLIRESKAPPAADWAQAALPCGQGKKMVLAMKVRRFPRRAFLSFLVIIFSFFSSSFFFLGTLLHT